MTHRVLSEARKKLREAALERRRTRTPYEIEQEILEKKKLREAEKDVGARLTNIGQTRFTRTAAGYQLFVFDPERVKALMRVRPFFFPGYTARQFGKNCLTIVEMNMALGLPDGRLKQWIKQREFPVPIGKAYLGPRTKAEPVYTFREALTYMKFLNVEIGNPENHTYWDVNKHRVAPILHAARKAIVQQMFDNGNPNFKLRDEVKSG